MKAASTLAGAALALACAGAAAAASVSQLAIAAPGLKGAGALTVSSPAFTAGGAIPEVYSSYGQGVSPPLAWSRGPRGTRSFVLIIEDPDAPTPTPFIHWMIWDLPAGATGLAQGAPPPGARQGKLMFVGKVGYMGPRPPPGPAHHYHFQVFALDRALELADGAELAQLEEAMKGHVLASGDLVGTLQKT